MKLCLFIFWSCLIFNGYSQDDSKHRISEIIVNTTFENEYYNFPKKRIYLSFKGKNKFQIINPINYISSGLLFFYQRIISEQISADCMYETSCSQHAKQCMHKYGLIKGVLLGTDQLTNCFPSIVYDYPPHMINSNGKIINLIND